MIIGVDGNEANVPLKVGVSTYAYQLLSYFQKHTNATLRFRVFLKNPPAKDLPRTTSYFTYEVIPGPVFWSQVFLPLRLYMTRDIGVFFSPAHYAPRFCPVPTVVTIHDLSYIYFPGDFLKKDLYQLKNWTAYSVRNAAKIIAVSKTTKNDILKNYELPEDKIEVVYNGYERRLEARNSKLEIKKIKNPYILYVGTLQPRKNLTVLIQAFSGFKKLHPEFRLVISGKKGWLFKDIFDLVKELGLEKAVKFTDYVPNQELVYLYKNAFCFVMPSFYEGFGIPVLEAMSFGCPVVSSFTSSLPEIGGDACLYFDPKDPPDLIDKLEQIKNNPDLRSDLIQKGKKRAKEFSWQKCGEQTLSIIQNAVQ